MKTLITICPSALKSAASLYEHCVRAILNGLKFGEHGLPLIGSGDWNDGMNLVGETAKAKASGWDFSFMKCSCASPRWPARRATCPSPSVARKEAAELRRNIEQTWLGRRVVPPRLLRRRHAAGVGEQPRMPDRFDCAKLVGAFRCGRS